MKTNLMTVLAFGASIGCAGTASLGSGQQEQKGAPEVGAGGQPSSTTGSSGYRDAQLAGETRGGDASPDGLAGTAEREAGDSGCAPPAWPEGVALDGSLEFEPIETWHGYAQNWEGVQGGYLTLYVKSRDAGVFAGAVMFGEAPFVVPEAESYMGPVEGYVYSMLNSQIDGARWRFDVSYADPKRSWCEQQTVYGSPAGRFNCVPYWGGEVDETGDFRFVDPDGGPDVVVDQQMLELCDNDVCQCNACGCNGNSKLGSSFDLRYSRTQITGVFDEYNVFLEPVVQDGEE